MTSQIIVGESGFKITYMSNDKVYKQSSVLFDKIIGIYRKDVRYGMFEQYISLCISVECYTLEIPNVITYVEIYTPNRKTFNEILDLIQRGYKNICDHRDDLLGIKD